LSPGATARSAGIAAGSAVVTADVGSPFFLQADKPATTTNAKTVRQSFIPRSCTNDGASICLRHKKSPPENARHTGPTSEQTCPGDSASSDPELPEIAQQVSKKLKRESAGPLASRGPR
jgi:hypothetical protein